MRTNLVKSLICPALLCFGLAAPSLARAAEEINNEVLNKAVRAGISLEVIMKQIESSGENCHFDGRMDALTELQKAAKEGGLKAEEVTVLQKKVIDISIRDKKLLAALSMTALNVFENADKDEYELTMRTLMSKGGQIVPFLLENVHKESARMRSGIVDALGRIGEKSDTVLKEVSLMLIDREKPVRLEAAKAAAALAGPNTCDDLINRLKNPNSKLDGVAMALGYMQDPRAVDPLTRLLRVSVDSDARVCAAFSLGQLRAKSAESSQELLNAILDERDEKLRDSAASAMELIHDSRTPSYIFRAVQRFRVGREDMLRHLKSFKDIAALDFLVEQFASDDPKMKKAAKDTLVLLTGDEQDDVEGWRGEIDSLRTRPDWMKSTSPAVPDINGRSENSQKSRAESIQTSN